MESDSIGTTLVPRALVAEEGMPLTSVRDPNTNKSNSPICCRNFWYLR